jgi:hypothetical protein
VQEELLAKRKDADVKVYAIYFEAVHDDVGAKSRIDPKTLFGDPRVTVFWDDERVAGRWFDENVTKGGQRLRQPDRVEWDCFILYGPDAKWGDKGPDAVSWGRTVYEERDRLAQELDATLKLGMRKP